VRAGAEIGDLQEPACYHHVLEKVDHLVWVSEVVVEQDCRRTVARVNTARPSATSRVERPMARVGLSPSRVVILGFQSAKVAATEVSPQPWLQHRTLRAGRAMKHPTTSYGSLLSRNRRFITLAAGMALGFFAQFGMIAHLFSLLVPALGTQSAGVALGSIGLAAILGRQLFTKLLVTGRDRRVAAAFNLGVQILGSIVFFAASGESVFLLLTGVVLFGIGLGNGASLPPLVAQVEFTKDDVSRAVPAIIGIAQATSAFGPMVFGLIRDLMVGCAASTCANAPLVFTTALSFNSSPVPAF
jgi:hypothetical protein